MTIDSSFEELKTHLKQLELEKSKYESLLKERTELDKQAHELTLAIELKLFEMHRARKKSPQKAEQLQQIISFEKKIHYDLSVKINEIDILLEILENSEEKIYRISCQLLDQIFKSNPLKKETYLNIENSIVDVEESFKELDQFTALLNEINKQFQAAKATLESSKQKTILEYLFGRNTKVIVANYLHQISLEIIKWKGDWERVIHNSQINKEKVAFYISLKHFLEKIKKEVEKPWKQSQFTTKFYELNEGYTALFESFKKLKVSQLEKKEQLQKELRSFLE